MNGKLTALIAAIVLAAFAGTTEAFGTAGPATLAEPGAKSILVGTALAKPLRATASPRTPAAFTATCVDATGDAGTGPDISSVEISNDPAGNITIQVMLPNRPTPASGFYTEIEIDADFNPATGEPGSGADYFLAGDADGFGLARWSGTAWEGVPPPASLNGSYSGGMIFTINASDLGGTTAFLFWVGVTEDPAATAFRDVAPEMGLFPYFVVEPAPVAVEVVPPKAGLAPRAGKVFSAQGIKVELDSGELVAPDERTCVLKIAGKVAKPMAGGCKWRIPAIAAGKRGVLSVTVTHGDVTLTEKYPLKVAR